MNHILEVLWRLIHVKGNEGTVLDLTFLSFPSFEVTADEPAHILDLASLLLGHIGIFFCRFVGFMGILKDIKKGGPLDFLVMPYLVEPRLCRGNRQFAVVFYLHNRVLS